MQKGQKISRYTATSQTTILHIIFQYRIKNRVSEIFNSIITVYSIKYALQIFNQH